MDEKNIQGFYEPQAHDFYAKNYPSPQPQEHEPNYIGYRILASLVDTALSMAVIGSLIAVYEFSPIKTAFPDYEFLAIIILFYGVNILYYILFEGSFMGATLGQTTVSIKNCKKRW